MDLHFNFKSANIGNSIIVNADCFDWLAKISENTLHAVVTDPPYGIKEYESEQLEKRSNGKGGIWRLPPAFDNNIRAPLPRFTALNGKERKTLYDFFFEWSKAVNKALRPGAHIFIATNAFMSQLLCSSLVDGGLEFRGQIIRLVRTLRGGDRPKNAEQEYAEVSSLPRGCYEPWILLRKPMPNKMKVSECLKEYQTGGLRRIAIDRPFEDVIQSERTPQRERRIVDHPSLKPQSFMRKIVYASLPLGEGIICDPFMGSGSTIAAAEALRLKSIGIEKNKEYFESAFKAIPILRDINGNKTHKKKSNGQIEIFSL